MPYNFMHIYSEKVAAFTPICGRFEFLVDSNNLNVNGKLQNCEADAQDY